jgi:hypothetical protein
VRWRNTDLLATNRHPAAEPVKVLRMPAHDGGATRTGAGVRKPPWEETAGDVMHGRVRGYGDFDAGGVLPRYVDLLVED